MRYTSVCTDTAVATTVSRVSLHRVPSVRTYARLRATLGLEGPPACLIPRRLSVGLDEDRVAALCAALLVTRDVPLADLASALDISIAAVRENLDGAAERLAPVGFSLTDDGGNVRLSPLSCAEAAVRTITDVEDVAAPSAEQLEILAIVAYFGHATRALVEKCRGEDFGVAAPPARPPGAARQGAR